jgi:hypothetical protein
MLDRRSNEANRPACHYTSHAVTKYRQLSLLLFASSPHGSWLSSSSGLNYMLVDQAAVLCEGSQHHAVHAHPADKRRSSAFVEAIDAFFSDGLEEAVERALELRVRLEADLDGIERVTLPEVSQTVYVERNCDQYENTYPTLSFATPEKTPATKPLYWPP